MIIQPAHLTPSSSSPTASSAFSPRDHIYKGKYTHRSWQQLPPELVRTIATHYLLDLQLASYCPLTWDAEELWHPRIVYTTFRDAIALEKLMQVTPSWAAALETHLFWSKACAVLDPHDVLAHYQYVRPQQPLSGAAGAAPAHLQHPYRISPFRHFRQMSARTCFVCRVNSPFSSVGLAVAKRSHITPTLGTVTLCRDHRKNSFCGLCLREAPPAETDPQFDMHGNAVRFTPYQQPYGHPTQLNMGVSAYTPYTTPLNPALMVCCADNEDDDTWPNVDATCRSCRGEWLWQRISISLRDREAVGGPRFVPSSSRSVSIKDRVTHSRYPPSKYASADWETRQTVDAFIDLGEGSIAEVIAVAREKFWLRSQTKMPELMEQAVAATRWAGEGMGVDFTPHTPVVNQTADHPSAHISSSAGAVQHPVVVGEADSPGGSTSPSPPSPRSVQRSRSPSPRSVYSSEYEVSEEDEDPELLSLTEDAGGVRELAIADWARTRILDGHWCNPADQWYGYAWPAGGGVRDAGEDTESEPEPDEDVREGCTVRRTVRVEAVHPCPWTVTSTSVCASATTSPTSPVSPTSPTSHTSNDSTGSTDDDIHPRISTVRAHAPPSFALCEQAYHAYQKQLRSILLPAMTNLVRKCVMEFTSGVIGAGDPATRVAKMGLEEVLAELRTPGVWFDGVDWAAGGLQRNRDRHASARESGRGRDREGEREREEDSASSTSSRSGGSHTTSPVLSTTTLQTTPSPPPAQEKDKGTGEHDAAIRKQPPPPVVIPIPISPVLPSPRLIHPIPYVPATLVHMAQYSLEAFKNVWREACAPLYHCRCSICERAMVRANMAAGHTVPSHGQAPNVNGHANSNQNTHANQHTPVVYQSHPYPHEAQQGDQPAEIALEEVPKVPRHALAQEEEEEEEEEEGEVYEEGAEDEEGEEEEEEEEEEEAEEEEEEEESEDSSVDAPPRPRTPLHPRTHTKIAPPRLNPRKRSSDDLEGDPVPSGPDTDGAGVSAAGGRTRVGTPPKRAKVGSYTPPASEERATTRNGPGKSSRGPSTPVRNGTAAGTGTGKEMLGTATTPSSRQRKRSSEELDMNGDASPRPAGDDKQQKRLRVEGSTVSVSPSKGRNARTQASGNGAKAAYLSRSPRPAATPARGSGSASPPSSVTVTSVDVDVDGGIGSLKAGLVNGGELDGLYVFEET